MARTLALRILAAAIGLATTATLAGCSSGGGGSAPTNTATGTGKLTIGIADDEPGVSAKAGTGYQGFDIDTAAYIAGKLDVPTENITWKPLDPGERIAALEKSSYTGAGKQAVADPMVEQLIAEMRHVTAQRAADQGRTEGMSDTAKAIIGGLGLLLTLSALYTFTQQRPTTPAAPQVIYVPAPAGALLPTTPPQAAPR